MFAEINNADHIDASVSVDARARAYVYNRSLAEDCGSESHRAHGSLSVVIVVCCQIEISATG
jgi:hypothetical protein